MTSDSESLVDRLEEERRIIITNRKNEDLKKRKNDAKDNNLKQT
jgi:hypothetical protein